MIRLEGDQYIGRVESVVSQGFHFFGSPLLFKYLDPANPCSLNIGDIVQVDVMGDIRSLWHPEQKENVVFMTSNCNQHCVYCPQPRAPKSRIEEQIIYALLNELRTSDIKYVTVTGGEPTVTGSLLPFVLQELLKKNKKAIIAVLTNGMYFMNYDYANEVVAAGKSQTRICVSLHADIASLHDIITRTQGSFEITQLGLLNLQRAGADIEIRVVLSKLNAKRLSEIAQYIGMNFPFVSHVAFMGLELHADAAEHVKEVWIDPPGYMSELSKAIYRLACHHIPASIYNLPYCLVPESLWCYLRDSISAWKKTFTQQCDSCTKKSICPGLFGTSIFQSPTISAITRK